jgi:xanthine dehydrogenase accessory factor
MVIGEGNIQYGTIGGGILEATTLKQTAEAFAHKTSRIMSFEMLGNNALAPAPICGGSATLLLDYIQPAAENIIFFRRMLEAVRKGDDFSFLTVLRDTGNGVDILGHSMLNMDGEASGTYDWPELDLERVKSEAAEMFSIGILSLADTMVVVHPIRKLKTMYCFGSGHVAVPTALLASMAGFQVTLVDDRAEFANRERFPDATEIIVIEDYHRALEGLPIDGDSFIVIITRGHTTDRLVLEQALKTDASYIGMMGSKRKRATIYEALLSQSITKEQLDNVHCPIGLEIGAETPVEIAVSIVAELIAKRARKRD